MSTVENGESAESFVGKGLQNLWVQLAGKTG